MKTSSNKFLALALCGGALAAAAGCANSSSYSTPASSGPTMQAATSEYPDDAMITKNVSNQLVDDLGIKKENVKVETIQGVVTLTGAVENDQLRARAARIASGVRGVKEVQNQILLMSDVPPMPPH